MSSIYFAESRCSVVDVVARLRATLEQSCGIYWNFRLHKAKGAATASQRFVPVAKSAA